MKMMGHRGARDRAPENTLRSFEFALQSGVAAVEFDIHESQDGVWVVHHDDTLDRTTISTGRVDACTWNELSNVRTKEGDLLPRLEQVLELFKGAQTELQIEVKSSGNFKVLAELLKNNFPSERLTVISFNHRWLREFRDHSAIKTTCLLFGLPLNPVQIMESAGAQGISLSVNWIDQQLVAECHAAGFTVTAWNANDEATFQKMKRIGVDCLGTDVPFTAASWS
ncbi:glycerophosphodiester phosphodiesterase [Bdellovibrio bacteriovorus]|uniref:Putative phosphodiesterase n=1 Tax=Bdellovibrio bacteriovorus str. Tiberius TaxID=1069642 RepID=K7YTV5_BDEBC|nr:glycerophosphodiester phosphodiesterase [Bdellovibrio bacteriovorus]AFY01063.1 putative phosphodiesterase [Bdellovibrio bacteriovorus str. Tiberius]